MVTLIPSIAILGCLDVHPKYRAMDFTWFYIWVKPWFYRPQKQKSELNPPQNSTGSPFRHGCHRHRARPPRFMIGPGSTLLASTDNINCTPSNVVLRRRLKTPKAMALDIHRDIHRPSWPYGGFHGHGGSPNTLVGWVHGKSHRSKWMMTRGPLLSRNLHLLTISYHSLSGHIGERSGPTYFGRPSPQQPMSKPEVGGVSLKLRHYPLVVLHSYKKRSIYSWFAYEHMNFSMAILVYQRVVHLQFIDTSLYWTNPKMWDQECKKCICTSLLTPIFIHIPSCSSEAHAGTHQKHWGHCVNP